MTRLLLVGGGHSHVEVLRRFAAEPLAGSEGVLVSPERHLFYTGMLPGLIAGHYRVEECRIDLESLCRGAGLRFVRAEAVALDLARGELISGDGSRLGFDLASLNVGGAPVVEAGDTSRAFPVKPFTVLLRGWEHIQSAARTAPQDIVVVGGGAGGVELALAIDHRLRAASPARSRISLVTQSSLLEGHPAAAGRFFEALLAERGIALHCRRRVESSAGGVLRLEGGERLPAGWTIWATPIAAPDWLAASGLATDARGFVTVDSTLRSVSDSRVYAAGDCASLAGHALPKAGVYAVRAAPVLAANLRAVVEGTAAQAWVPQRRALALIGTGDRRAVATWGSLTAGGSWAWRWKRRIDRRFIAKYRAG